MGDSSALPRVAYSPGEFAKLFGKAQTWGYRQIYSGKVKTITEYGRIQIPASEVERILETAGIYNGLPPRAKAKADAKQVAASMANVWTQFLAARRSGVSAAAKQVGEKAALEPKGDRLTPRQAALARLARRDLPPQARKASKRVNGGKR